MYCEYISVKCNMYNIRIFQSDRFLRGTEGFCKQLDGQLIDPQHQGPDGVRAQIVLQLHSRSLPKHTKIGLSAPDSPLIIKTRDSVCNPRFAPEDSGELFAQHCAVPEIPLPPPVTASQSVASCNQAKMVLLPV